MKKSLSIKGIIASFLLSQFFNPSEIKAQNIGINSTGVNAHPSALLDVDDAGINNKGLLIPRIPLNAINVAAPVISPATSLLVYNTATASTGTNAITPGYYYWDATKWVRFAYNPSGSSANAWTILGNANTNSTINFLGTTDAQDLVFKTNNLEAVRITTVGNVGIGTPTPIYPLHVVLPDNGSLNGIRFEGLRTVAGGHTVRLEIMGVNSPATANKKNFQITNSTPTDGSQNRLLFTSVNDAQTTLSNYILSLEHDGNVGIGTPTPLVKLQVEGTSNNLMNLINTSSSINVPAWQNYIQFGDGTIDAGYVGEGSSGKLMGLVGHYAHGVSIASFQGNSSLTENSRIDLLPGGNSSINFSTKLTNRMIIDSVGDVGIGTTAPSSQLHIVGVGNPLFNNGLTVQSPNAVQSLDVLPGFVLTNSTAAGVQENLTMTLRSSGTFAGNMAFATGNEERMRLLANGYFGIGTSSPSQKLHINEGYALIDNTTLTETALFLNNNNTGTNSSSYISFRNQAGNSWNNYMGGPTGYAGVIPNAMEWWEYPASQSLNPGTCCLARFRISPNNTGVGYATVVIDGTGQMFGNGWAQPSDRTLKTNIKSLTHALDKISKLGGYSYNFTKESGLDDGKVHIGVIAQEVEAVLPEAVSEYPQASYKAINYDALIPLQIEAFKELIQENKQQQNQIDALLKRIEQLEKKN